MSVSVPFGQSARSASILVVDDEPDVADLFRQHFRREARQGTYVMHFAASGAEVLDRLSGEIKPTLVAVLSDINIRVRETTDHDHGARASTWTPPRRDCRATSPDGNPLRNEPPPGVRIPGAQAERHRRIFEP
jgi:hypothetical protein